MLRKLNWFLNIIIGSFIGVFIGFVIYKFWHFKTYPNLYAMQSAPWYTGLLLGGGCCGGCCGGRMYHHKTDYLEKVKVVKSNLTKECYCMDMIKILQFVVLAFGVKEFYNAVEYCKQKKKKWAIASLYMGIFACTCSIVSLTGIL